MSTRLTALSLLAPLVLVACGGTVTPATNDDGGVDSTADALPDDTLMPDSALPDSALPDTAEPPPDVATKPTNKVDVLFVVDNSLSMSDKQRILAKRIPAMLHALTTPGADGKRADDVHVAFISSSLGSFGTSACAPELTSKASDDKAHLLPRDGVSGSGYRLDSTGAPTAAACPSVPAASTLTWTADPTKGGKYSGDAGGDLALAASCVMGSVDQVGCGYEQPLEAAYRFLSDPAPYATAAVKCTFGVSGDACGNNDILVNGLDTDLLAQRAAFLRPDSAVVVVYITDENDVSLRPAGKNWLPFGYGAGAMQRGWTACASIPDDVEPESSGELTAKGCFSCFQDNKNPACSTPWAKDKLNADPDGRNLRGFHMVQRYGFNFLWSRDRYVNGFTANSVLGSNGKLGVNGLFAGGLRSKEMVFVTGIVGVSSPLVADAAGKPRVLGAAEWDKIAGPVALRDPHMIESIGPRAGVGKFAGDRTIDPIHGGDRDIYDGDDLQYACISPRETGSAGSYDCEALGTDAAKKSPLCDSSSKQSYFKAYPSLRPLRVFRALGAQSTVGSICSDLAGPLTATVEKVRTVLK